MFLDGLKTLVKYFASVILEAIHWVLYPHMEIGIFLAILMFYHMDIQLLVVWGLLWWLWNTCRLLGLRQPGVQYMRDEDWERIHFGWGTLISDRFAARLVAAILLPLSLHYVGVWLYCLLHRLDLGSYQFTVHFLNDLEGGIADVIAFRPEVTRTPNTSPAQPDDLSATLVDLKQCDVSLKSNRVLLRRFGSQCAVCLVQLRPTRQRPYVMINSCKHSYHSHCLLQWVNSMSSNRHCCPLCRVRFVLPVTNNVQN